MTGAPDNIKTARKVLYGESLVAVRHALAEAIGSVTFWQEEHPLEDHRESTRLLRIWHREGRRIDRLLASGRWRGHAVERGVDSGAAAIQPGGVA